MKYFYKMLLYIATLFVVLYILVAVGQASFNIKEWVEVARTGYSVLGGFGACLIVFFTMGYR